MAMGMTLSMGVAMSVSISISVTVGVAFSVTVGIAFSVTVRVAFSVTVGVTMGQGLGKSFFRLGQLCVVEQLSQFVVVIDVIGPVNLSVGLKSDNCRQ